MSSGIFYNQEVTAADVNDIAKDLGNTSFNGFGAGEGFRALKVYGGCGKNLPVYPYYHAARTTNGITYTDNGDGTITVNGTATGTAYHYQARVSTENMLCEGGKTYTFSWGGVGSGTTYYGFVKVDNAVKTAANTGS